MELRIMRLAIISDIHGNLTSFEAVLADIEKQQIDQIICLGDVAAIGPQPRECLALLQTLDCPVVMGNTDEFLLDPVIPPGTDVEELIPKVEIWGAELLTPADRDFLATFQPTIELDLGNEKSMLAFHGSPRSNLEIILATTPEDELDDIFLGTSAMLLAGGHTHVPLLRRRKDALLLNPGSVGLPFETPRGSDEVRTPPWAEYAIASTSGPTLEVSLRRIPIDVAAVRRAIFDSEIPYADQIAGDWG